MKICEKKYFEIIMQITTAQQIPGECLRLFEKKNNNNNNNNNKNIFLCTFENLCYFIHVIIKFLE